MQSCGTCPWLIRLSFLSTFSLRKVLQEKVYFQVHSHGLSSFVTFSFSSALQCFVLWAHYACVREGLDAAKRAGGNHKLGAHNSICVTECMIWAAKVGRWGFQVWLDSSSQLRCRGSVSSCLSAEVTVAASHRVLW